MLFSPTYYHERKEHSKNMYKHYRKYNLTSLFQEPEILTCFFSLNACTNSPFDLSSQGFLYRLILSKVRSVSVLEMSPFSRGSISRLQLCESILVWSILEYIWFTITKYLSVIQLSSVLYLRWWEGLFCEVDFLFFLSRISRLANKG